MIGIIPAAGRAERMGGIPKFLLPVPGGFLLERLIADMQRNNGALEKLIVIGHSYNIGQIHDNTPKNVTSMIVNTETMSQTILAARRNIPEDSNILFGMPDTYFDSPHAFYALCNHLSMGADVAVGLWYTDLKYRSKRGMCEVQDGRVTRVIDKPIETDLTEGWGILAWKPSFWSFIKPEMPTVGFALQTAIDAGLRVDAVRLSGTFTDCGTPEEYFALIRYLTEVRNAV